MVIKKMVEDVNANFIAAIISLAVQGRDMIGHARTETGKTLAFGIPILDKTIQYNKKHGRERNPLAIIMAPTKQLARQVGNEFYECAPELDTLCVYGGGALNLSEVGDSDQKLADGITSLQSAMTETNALATAVEYLLIYKSLYPGSQRAREYELPAFYASFPGMSDVVETETWCQSERRIGTRRDSIIEDHSNGEVIPTLHSIKILPVAIHMSQIESVKSSTETTKKVEELKKIYQGKTVIMEVDDMDVFKVSTQDKVAYYAISECVVVNAVRDGMNLMPYKYTVSRQSSPELNKALAVGETEGGKSLIIVSEFIGALPVMEHYTEATDGSSLEMKESALVWHHQEAEPDFGMWQAKELLDRLQSVLANEPMVVKRGQQIVEVNPQLLPPSAKDCRIQTTT
nr:DEAD-box ATP-dependent RNA helicase 53, mitochondrial-like [Tanacetum cinerariifolium]